MSVDFSFYKRVMEFLAQYLGLANEPLYMRVVRFDEVIGGVKVLVEVYRANGNEPVKYCVVRFDNALGKAEPTCVEDEGQARRIYESY